MKILIVEDQDKMVSFLKRGLTELGLEVTGVHTAAEAAAEAESKTVYDVIVLDLMLPDRDGLDLLQHWRQNRVNLPVLILSARNTVKDRIQGLEYGADDYLPKPFSIEELFARIHALARRRLTSIDRELHHRDLTFNPASGVVMHDTKRVEFTARETALLEVFLQNIGRTMTRSLLAEKVWAMDYDEDSNLLDVYMSRLRAKLESPDRKPYFETVRGMGYKMV